MAETKHILVLDEDPSTHTTLAAVPSSQGWIVENADGLDGALARLNEKAYDLILTGLGTSGVQDVDVLRRLRQARPGTKVIVMTAESTPEALLASMREHAFSYFSKPITAESLAEMIERALAAPAWDDGIVVLSARPSWVTLQVRCQRLTAERLLQYMRELKADLPEQERDDVGTAFREILMNAIEHGGHSDPQKCLYLSCLRTSRMILYYVRDPGDGFALDALPHAAISNPPNSPFAHILYRAEHEMRAGGFGIDMTRKLVDELIYNEAGNEVVLIKYL